MSPLLLPTLFAQLHELTGLMCAGFFGLIALAAMAFWVWMLVDCLVNEPSQGNDKIIWALVILLVHVLGAILYYLVRRPTRIRDHGR